MSIAHAHAAAVGGECRKAAPPPWIECRAGLPYFVTSEGAAWTPIGHNDAVDWPELRGLFGRRDVASVRQHLHGLKAAGVTCLRLMLEYSQGRHRYLERPAGTFAPAMVRFWDDLFALCEESGLHLLLTPFDTFFAWRRWQHHPYNQANGGPCADRSRWLTCGATRAAIKKRFEFVVRRWGGSPVLFGWDLWNELHPAHAEQDASGCADFVSDISHYLRRLERSVHGRTHLQTVSVFGPELRQTPALAATIYRHPGLDFVNTHLYEADTIDNPRDTVAPALATGKLIREALGETRDARPVFDSEHGPIHAFIDHHRTLPEAFDNQYFRHIQWAHLASGGAGGGMRWPNRHPHCLTPGMREAQGALSRFLPLIDWTRFRRVNLNEAARTGAGLAAFACGDGDQAVAWLLRTDSLGADGMLRSDLPGLPTTLGLPGLHAGCYRVTEFCTRTGRVAASRRVAHAGGQLVLQCAPVIRDVAVAVSSVGA